MSRPAVTPRPAPRVYRAAALFRSWRPRLELLEDRLPPGDLLGAAWAIPAPSAAETPVVTAPPEQPPAAESPAVAPPPDTAEQPAPTNATVSVAADLIFANDLIDPLTEAGFLEEAAEPVRADGVSGLPSLGLNRADADNTPGASASAGQPARPPLAPPAATISTTDPLWAAASTIATDSFTPVFSPSAAVFGVSAASTLLPGRAADVVPGELILRLGDDTAATLAAVRSLADAYRVSVEPLGVAGFYRLNGSDTDLAGLRPLAVGLPGIADVSNSPTARLTDTTPNETWFTNGTLYGLSGTNGIKAPAAWDLTTGSTTVLVGVIDTGIDYNHPDLYLNIWINQGEIPSTIKSNLTDTDSDGLITFWDLNDSRNQGANKITDQNADGRISASDILAATKVDGTGGWANGTSDDGTDADGISYVDDLVGWNWVTAVTANKNKPLDDHGHGSHVSGTIGAIGNNATGVVGVNWKVQLMPLKVVSSAGTLSYANAASALTYAANHGARVSNNSYGGGASSSAFNAAIDAVRTKTFPNGAVGQVVVFSAGNSSLNVDTTTFYPTNQTYSNMLVVAATDSNGTLASFSNYGATRVDLAAPGVNILSTTPNNTYSYADGTSMAAPHAVGVIALMLAQKPALSASSIISRIEATVTTKSALSGKMVAGGIVNAFAALNHAPTLAAVSDKTVPNGQSSVTFALSGTDSDGDSLTYSAAGVSLAYYYDQKLGLTFTGSYSQNYGGANEKWLQGTGGAWYFILPNGDLVAWDGQPNKATGTVLASLGSSYWTDPTTLYSAVVGTAPATVSVNGNQVTVAPNTGIPKVAVQAWASDGYLTSAKQLFLVSQTVAANQPPVLSPILAQTMTAAQTSLVLTLSATDPDGDTVTFSASAVSLAYHLDQKYGLTSTGNYYQDYGGQNEKWLQGTGSLWYFIKPDGGFYLWNGASGQATGTLLATLDSSYWTDPSTLHNAPNTAVPVTFGVVGNQLTITPQAGFSGSFVVSVTASDGKGGTDVESFVVTKTSGGAANQPPVLAAIANQTMAAAEVSRTVTLSATDPDGDTLTYSATAISLAYHLDQKYGLTSTGNYYTNYGGANEKWLQGTGGVWYFIKPDGGLYLWDGTVNQATGTLLATLDSSYWTDPTTLTSAPNSAVPVTFGVVGNQLTITPQSSFRGTFVVQATADDLKGGTDSETFFFTVTN